MSVLRQLLLSVTLAIVVILAGTLVFSISGARDYLNAQLQAESDNAATSLALTLSQPANQDPALRELLITALFDSGQFEAIELRDPLGSMLVQRRTSHAGDHVAPRWFAQALPLRAPHAVRQVSDGWTQVGQLTVVSDDSAARAALWDSTVRVFGWVVLAGVAWLVFVLGLVRWMRRSLHEEITRQVNSIADGNEAAPGKAYRQIADLLPSRQVLVQARERIKASRQEATDRIESLTLALNTDAVSGLPNRRYFMNELRRALHGAASASEGLPAANATGEPVHDAVLDPAASALAAVGGYLLLCRQRDLAAMSQTMPREQVDAWLHDVGDRLRRAALAFTGGNVHVARLNGSDFVLLIPQSEGPQAMSFAQAVRTGLMELRVPVQGAGMCRWALAMTDYLPGDALPAVIARLDTALMAAESAGDDDVEVVLRDQTGLPGPGPQVVGEAAWRNLLGSALAQDRLGLTTQRANFGPRPPRTDRYEASLSLTDPDYNDGQPLSGYLFMPAAVRLGMSDQLDERALQLARVWLDRHRGELVLRISAASLIRPGFIEAAATAARMPGADRLIIELDAYSLATWPAETTELCYALHQAGVRVGLRGVTRQLDVLAQLQGLPLAYIKLGGGFMDQLDTSQGAISLLNAVIHTAMALRIRVLVDDTPSDVITQLLHDHGALLRRDD